MLSSLGLPLAGVGCSMIPAYRMTTQSPQKDVLRCVIYLDRRADSEVYQAIALRELSRISAAQERRSWPLYEVSFEFLQTGDEPERLAQVKVFLDRDVPRSAVRASTPDQLATAAAPPRLETILY